MSQERSELNHRECSVWRFRDPTADRWSTWDLKGVTEEDREMLRNALAAGVNPELLNEDTRKPWAGRYLGSVGSGRAGFGYFELSNPNPSPEERASNPERDLMFVLDDLAGSGPPANRCQHPNCSRPAAKDYCDEHITAL